MFTYVSFYVVGKTICCICWGTFISTRCYNVSYPKLAKVRTNLCAKENNPDLSAQDLKYITLYIYFLPEGGVRATAFYLNQWWNVIAIAVNIVYGSTFA